MTQQQELIIEKEIWDDLADSEDLAKKDEIEDRARRGTLIVKDGQAKYRPVEVPETGWELQPVTDQRKS